jgi:prevent-host-death family protein
MQGVNIADLKNNLSHYLKQVREGNEILVRDRDRVIARIIPAVPHAKYDDELVELAVQGKVRLPTRPIDRATIAETLKRRLPRLKITDKNAGQLLRRIMDDERGEQ